MSLTIEAGRQKRHLIFEQVLLGGGGPFGTPFGPYYGGFGGNGFFSPYVVPFGAGIPYYGGFGNPFFGPFGGGFFR